MSNLHQLCELCLTCAVLLGAWSVLAANPVKYTYDGAGRLVKADYGEGVTVTYSYDKNGNMVSQSSASPVGFSFPFYQGDATIFSGFAASNFSERAGSR